MFYEFTSHRWVWSSGMLSSPLQAEDTPACRPQRTETVFRIVNKSWRSGVVNITGPNASAEVIAFQPEYWQSFLNSKRKFFFSDIKRVAGVAVLHKLGKALVHSGDVTMNICFLKVRKRWLYSSHGFLRGSSGSSSKALGYVLDGLGSIPGVGEVEIFFTPSYPDCSWGPLSLL